MIVWDKKTIDESAQLYREVLCDGDSLRSCAIGKADDGTSYTAIIFIVSSDVADEMMTKLGPLQQLMKSFGNFADSLHPIPVGLPAPMMMPPAMSSNRNALTDEELRELGLLE